LFDKRNPIKAYGVSRSLEGLFAKRNPIKEKKQKKITKKPVHSRRLLTTVHRTVDYPSGGRSD
jgi:hypothetical protein